jgi:hypothetical protein
MLSSEELSGLMAKFGVIGVDYSKFKGSNSDSIDYIKFLKFYL